MSKSGKIAAVAGLEGLPNMIASMGGFRLGAKSVRPDIEVKVIYLQSMEDPAAAKEAAFSLVAGGRGRRGRQAQRRTRGAHPGGEGEERVHTRALRSRTRPSRPSTSSRTSPRSGPTSTRRPPPISAPAGSRSVFVAYGFHSQGTNGADLRYSTERAYHPAVPAAVAAEIEAVKKKLAAGELKLKPTKEDAAAAHSFAASGRGAPPMLRMEGISEVVRRRARQPRHHLRRRGRAHRRPPRRERLWQDHAHERPLRHGPAGRGRVTFKGRTLHGPLAARRHRRRHRDDPPALHAGSRDDGDRERDARLGARPARGSGQGRSVRGSASASARVRPRARPGRASSSDCRSACSSASRSSRPSCAGPSFLILDEPTSNLSLAVGRGTHGILRRLSAEGHSVALI